MYRLVINARSLPLPHGKITIYLFELLPKVPALDNTKTLIIQIIVTNYFSSKTILHNNN